ncbi:hypothetical protein DAETH_48210 (plasmid) [Deinococcus aetherius]|uniref:Phage protein n=1 Tax=Deinococcus aetherius TaxID=200252 RepID=A0ABN6RNI9_9DEIO|nr:hypothetical protein [Deinococcus aetherius]BDP44852.1 hypothetical protein DAETH_48210 [Deinococcus aetherius]
MTAYASEAELRAYAVGLTLPAEVGGALAQGNHWATRQVEKVEASPTGGALQDVKYAACAHALGILAGNGLITVAEQAAESFELGPLKFKLSKAQTVSLPDFATKAQQHLDDAGLSAGGEDQIEVVTRVRRRW